MSKKHVKNGDEVVILAGADKGNRGKIIEVQGKSDRVIVEGIRMQKKHQKKSQMNPQGAIVDREGPIHISNVMLAEKFDSRAAQRNGGVTPAKAEKTDKAETAEKAEG
jgi:large subunit ribosomal protein L24